MDDQDPTTPDQTTPEPLRVGLTAAIGFVSAKSMAHGNDAGGFGDRARRLRHVLGNTHVPFSISWQRVWLVIPDRGMIQRSVRTSRGGIGRRRHQRGHRELHPHDVRGAEGDLEEASSTAYESGSRSTLSSAITTGESVLVLGRRTERRSRPRRSWCNPPAPHCNLRGGRGDPLPAGCRNNVEAGRSDPANYSQGSGTIVSGTTAYDATEAALAAYPGGIVDRVVQLSNGEFEVHLIGVNWPHHVFVTQQFKVVGAN